MTRETQVRLRAALQFVMTSDIPSEHKILLVETLTQALRERESAAIRERAAARAAAEEWQPHEIAQLQAGLRGRVAGSWQQADELAMQLAAQLRRHPQAIRAKAAELGLAIAIDFRLAKAHLPCEQE